MKYYYSFKKLQFIVLWWQSRIFSSHYSSLSSVSHDPLEIILICWFGPQETFQIIIEGENRCAAKCFPGNCDNFFSHWIKSSAFIWNGNFSLQLYCQILNKSVILQIPQTFEQHWKYKYNWLGISVILIDIVLWILTNLITHYLWCSPFLGCLG